MVKTIYLIHHTHTDVGYTEIQGRITDRQIDFIRQALQFAEADKRFRWTCETFWAVEKFLETASTDEQDRLVKAVRNGSIGLSASYLNYSELLDYDTHRDLGARARSFAHLHGIRMSSAMTADINGHAPGYAQSLADFGVENLFACVHTWHGMYPLFKNQNPFYWRMPDGKSLLVWNGDHYHLGNELGLVPGAWMSHMVNDTFRPGDTNMSVAQRRIPRYLKKLEAESYPYDFLPLMVSGLMTDNAPPNPQIPDFLDAWNDRHGDQVRIEMATLDTFFDRLRTEAGDMPVYEGLWPDWWTDLTASSPADVQIFRQGQRLLSLYRELKSRHLDPAEMAVDPEGEPRNVEDMFALFAEHTFGHSATFMYPDHLLVAACSARKSGYAAESFERAQQLVDYAARQLGGERFRIGRRLKFCVMNPYASHYDGFASLELDGFEWGEIDVRFDAAGPVPVTVHGVEVADFGTGTPLPCQAVQVPRGVQVRVPVSLDAGAVQKLEVRRAARKVDSPLIRVSSVQGIDGAKDIHQPSEQSITGSSLETQSVGIEWTAEGITSWIDAVTGRQLLDAGRLHHAFTPVYEVSPGSLRTPMGRNRKGPNVVRTPGRLVNVIAGSAGPLFSTVSLAYDLPGTKTCRVLLRAFCDRPLVEVEVSLHKESSIDVESVYLSLPFSAGDASELWIDTSVKPMRPWKDQIPGTLTDFYHVHHGFGLTSDGFGVGVAMPDTPLLQLGSLGVKPRLLAGMPELDDEPRRPYAWLMNNFWETNANIDLAGFYRFRFAVLWGEEFKSAVRIVQGCRDVNQEVVVFRTR